MNFQKRHGFGHFYSTRNIHPTICQKNPIFGQPNSTRNILPTVCQKSPTFGHSYSTRNILPKNIEPLATAKRLATMLRPYMVIGYPMYAN